MINLKISSTARTSALKNHDLSRLANPEIEQRSDSNLIVRNLVAFDRKRAASTKNEKNPASTPKLKRTRRGGQKTAAMRAKWMAKLAADDPRRVKIQEKEQIGKLQQEKNRIKKEIEERDKWIIECKVKDVEIKGELDNFISNSLPGRMAIQHQQDERSPSLTPALKNQSADDLRREAILDNEQSPASTLAVLHSLYLAADDRKRGASSQIELSPAPAPELKRTRRGGQKTAALRARWMAKLAANDSRRVKIQEKEQDNEQSLTVLHSLYLAADDRKRGASSQIELSPAPAPELKRTRRGGQKTAAMRARWMAKLAANDPRRVKIQEKEQIGKLQQEKNRIKKEIEERDKWIIECKVKDVEMKGELDNFISNSLPGRMAIQHQQDERSPSLTPALKNQSADDLRREAILENEQSPASTLAVKNLKADERGRGASSQIKLIPAPAPEFASLEADDLRRPTIRQEDERKEAACEKSRFKKQVKGNKDLIMEWGALDVAMDEDNIIWNM